MDTRLKILLPSLDYIDVYKRQGYTNALKADSSEAQKKQEEAVNENYVDTKKVQDTDNTVDLTDVSDIKKLSTMGSNANVISCLLYTSRCV